MKNVFVLLVTTPGGIHADGVFDTMEDVDAYIVKTWKWVTPESLANNRYQTLKSIDMGAQITKGQYHQSRADKIDNLLKD